MPTLGGSLICCDGLKFDYCFIEATKSLLEFCDQVSVLLFTDEDQEEFKKTFSPHPLKLKLTKLARERWDKTRGRERLSFWTNFAKNCLTTDYHFNLQADEIVHEDSYPAIRRALETGQEGFIMRRFNLWGDCGHYLDVEHKRRPVSDYVIRLAKREYRSVDDAESLAVPNVSNLYMEDIRIYHMGFVRKKEVMRSKILNMQQNVFEIEPDKRVEKMMVFDPWGVDFKPEDVKPIPESLPRVIQSWAEVRP